ncbi:hypothetical protein NXS19_013005 [Fusarium pseudograminearum]|nr:hypothetical protein NXS19_013005 [Fusarium pseudograminearum]
MTTQAPDLTTTFTPAKSCFQYYKYRYTGDEITCQAGGTGAPSACTYMQLGPSGSNSDCFPSSLELVRQLAARRERHVVQVHLVVKQRQVGLGTALISAPSCSQVQSSGAAANAIGLPIRWHSSDFASTTSGTTTSATDSGTETITSSTSTSLSDPSSSNTGLSTGAKAGIGAGVGVVALTGLAALGWFVLRARRAKQANATSAAQEPKEPQMQQQQHPWELDSHKAMSPAELPSDNIPQTR